MALERVYGQFGGNSVQALGPQLQPVIRPAAASETASKVDSASVKEVKAAPPVSRVPNPNYYFEGGPQLTFRPPSSMAEFVVTDEKTDLKLVDLAKYCEAKKKENIPLEIHENKAFQRAMTYNVCVQLYRPFSSELHKKADEALEKFAKVGRKSVNDCAKKEDLEEARMDTSTSCLLQATAAKSQTRWRLCDSMVRGWANDPNHPYIKGIDLKKMNYALTHTVARETDVKAESYRKCTIFPEPDLSHTYVPHQRVDEEAAFCLDWINSELKECYLKQEADQAGRPYVPPETSLCRGNPITLAAKAYHAMVSIHPFEDGNGRTCRAVMDFILQKFGILPPPLESDEAGLPAFGLAIDGLEPKENELVVDAVINSLDNVYSRFL